MKRNIFTLARHPSLIADFAHGKRWPEIQEKADQLDELAASVFISGLRKYCPQVLSNEARSNRLSLCKLCCLEDFTNSEIKQALFEIKKPDINGLLHRKDWEWAMGIVAMDRMGKLNKNSKAVGIGCGTEVVPFYLANRIAHVYATDLYEGKEWSAASPTDFPYNPKKYATFQYREEALSVLKMDGTKLEFPSESFDIVFSFSSIEHFGGSHHSGALKSMKEMERVLKPGGIAVVATEYIINGKEHHEFFNSRTLFSDLIDKLASLRLVQPIDFNISIKTLDQAVDHVKVDMNWNKFSVEYKKDHPLILLRLRNLLFTSIMLVLSKNKSNGSK